MYSYDRVKSDVFLQQGYVRCTLMTGLSQMYSYDRVMSGVFL